MKKTIIVTSLILLGLWNSSDWARAHDGLGISSWASWNLRQVTRADCPEWRSVPLILPWKRLEPRLWKYEFDKYLGTPLRAAAEDDLHVFLMIWVGPVSPMRIY